MRARRGAGGIALLAMLALLAAAIPAQGDYDPIGSGRTTLSLDKRFLSFLKANGVKLTARAGARRRGKRVTLPVSGGEIDPTIEKGTIEHAGTLVFSRGKRSVPFRRLTLKVKPTPLQAKVGGSQLKVAKAKRISTKRSGFGMAFTAKGLWLAEKVITRLGKKLRLGKALPEGQPFASLRTRVQPLTVVVLAKGRATIGLDPGLVAKMNSLFVSINPIFPAELAPGSTLLTVPIIRKGALAPDASLGTLRTGGAIEFLQQGAGQVFTNEFWFDLTARAAHAELNIQPTPTFPGPLGQLPALGIGAFAAASNPSARTIAASGVPLGLGPQTAAAFNQAFAEGKPTFAPSEPFGQLSFAAQAQ